MGRKGKGKYIPLDTERIMRELKRADEHVQTQPEELNTEPDIIIVSAEEKARRRRQSLLDNPKNLYVYNRLYGTYHDRDCECVKKVKDKYFEMHSIFPKNNKGFCMKCLFKASIRWAACDKPKLVDAYTNFFRSLNVTTKQVYKLCVRNKTRFFNIESNAVYLEVKEDRWIIEKAPERKTVKLWHNDYAVESNYERVFLGGYHLQAEALVERGDSIISIMFNYSWPKHVKEMKEKAAYKEKEAFLAELRAKMKSKNCYCIEKFGRIFYSIKYIDINSESLRLFKEEKVWPIGLKCIDKESTYPIRRCYILCFKLKKFKKAMKKLRQMGISEEYHDYVDYCFDKQE